MSPEYFGKPGDDVAVRVKIQATLKRSSLATMKYFLKDENFIVEGAESCLNHFYTLVSFHNFSLDLKAAQRMYNGISRF